MQTVLSKTGIEVRYPCTVHLLLNGENFECDYKSDHTGLDLLKFVCSIQKIPDYSLWGLKYMDCKSMDEQRYWLDLDKLIRSQMKNISPIRFYFRAKVYPPEPYKVQEASVRHLLFQQLRLDLMGGRLFCEVNEAAMLVALVLQHVHSDFVPTSAWIYIMYMKSHVLRKERCSCEFYSAVQKRALDIYQRLLAGLQRLEIEDMFLRLASKLDSYGVEPFLVRNIDKQELLLCINFHGLRAYGKNKAIFLLRWPQVSKITHEGKGLFVHFAQGGVKVLECISFSECAYIWSIATDHHVYFTSPRYVSSAAREEDSPLPQDGRSDLSSFFGSCLNEYKCARFEHEMLEEQLQVSCSLLRLIDFNSWRSQLSVIYAVVILYIMGTHACLFEELPFFEGLKNWVLSFMSRLVFNKVLPF
ncbi:FERM domain-containing protein 5 [Dendroctonus ponderosae]|uniref:FERM domain-containing protein n=1 Tax=Dendroctonus ponderosae TaxID=77166 RepID=A0AAR5P0K4_DENPD|nr:FERM domain-containing protein 5 [Dendroctonus ponderosae]KAH1001693.1 hypothetical protein HUJ04_005673 [Dendroctonus ponderosae]KAH1001694.1 hypothetical protein HUJ04_005674 [Dendroctonus ponderosae]KAH1004653.1 hypothetical protein HUJ05_005440 [Dendroctonus ponderosae]